MKVDINEVARKSGVSIATVSRVFNGSDLVKKETKQKILKIADELNYIPNPIARSLSKRSTDTIGVILPDLVGEFFMEVISGIDKEAYKHNWYVTVSSSHNKRDIVETLIQFMGSGRVDGVILMAPQMHKEIYEMIKKSSRPIVLLNAFSDLKNVVNFKINNFQGAYDMVQHLIKKHKYKKIAFIQGPSDNSDAVERFQGYYQALIDHKKKVNESMIIPGDFSVEAGNKGLRDLMKLKYKPDAIFASNDMMAVGAYKAAHELKISIPGDVAIVGFDDIYLSQFLNPRLTTVHVPMEDLGGKAVKYLLGIINGTSIKKYVESLNTKLVIGDSCGCACN